MLIGIRPVRPQFKKLVSNPPLFGPVTTSYQLVPSTGAEREALFIHLYPKGSLARVFLYDGKERRLTGEIADGVPQFVVGDPPQIVCAQQVVTIGERFQRIIQTIARRWFKVVPPAPWRLGPPAALRYWLIDTTRNSAKVIGTLPGYASFCLPSPDSRYAINLTVRSNIIVHCLDLKRCTVTRLNTTAIPVTWWDNQRILLQTTNPRLELLDVVSGETSPFLSAKQIADFYQANSLPDRPMVYHFTATRNRGGSDVYIKIPNDWCLLKLERPDGKLKLIARGAAAEPEGQIDRTGRYLLFESTYASRMGGVYLRDLQDGSERVLVRPASAKASSQPSYCGDGVVYVRSNAVWRVSLDGSNNSQLFPPAN